MITQIPAGLITPKAFGVAEVEKPQSGGADCGCPFIRLTDTVQGTENQSEIDKRSATASAFLSSPSNTWRLRGPEYARNGISTHS
jgi:hypothetical protein